MNYRFAVVGCGLMGTRHADLVAGTEGFQLAAVVDHHHERAGMLARSHGVPVRSWEECLEDPSIHGIVLALPSHKHGDFGLKAIEAGKHLIMEKPLATKPEDARKLIHGARHSGLVLAVIAQNRFSDGALALKSIVQSGQLGRIVMARASVQWYRDDRYYTDSDWRGRIQGEGGGVLINQAIHSTDMLIHLLGRPQTVVCLCAKNRSVMETEDTAVAILGFPRHVVATLEASISTWPGFEESYSIHGEDGHAQIQRGAITAFATRSGNEPPTLPVQPPSTMEDQKLSLFQRQYWNILDALKNGPDKLFVTPEESLWVVETTRQMYESASQLSNETIGF